MSELSNIWLLCRVVIALNRWLAAIKIGFFVVALGGLVADWTYGRRDFVGLAAVMYLVSGMASYAQHLCRELIRDIKRASGN